MKLNRLNLVVTMLFGLMAALSDTSCTYDNKQRILADHQTSTAMDSLRYVDSVVNATKISNPEYAIMTVRHAFAKFGKENDKKIKVYLNLIAGIAFQLKDPDTAYRYYEIAIYHAHKTGAETLSPRILYNMAMLHKNSFNYREAINLLDSARQIAERIKDFTTLSNCYNTIGNIAADLNNEDQAISMFTKALAIAEEKHLEKQKGISLGSLARFEKERPNAFHMQIKALNALIHLKDAYGETGYLLTNIGEDFEDPDSAIRYFEKAIEIAEKGSIADLEIAALNSMAYRYADKRMFSIALTLLENRAIPLAIHKQNTEWLPTLYDSYAEILQISGKSELAYTYQKKAFEAAMLSERKQAANQVRLLNALLQTRSREIKILEQTVVIGNQDKKVRQLTWALSALIVCGLFVGMLLIVYIQRKNLQVQKKELEASKIMAGLEEQEKERMSYQLHDLIRPVKSVMVNHIDKLIITDSAVKTELIDLLEKVTVSLRQMSHRMNQVMRNRLSFDELVISIQQDFEQTSALDISISISPVDLRLHPECSNHLFFILHELLTNADKYVVMGKVEIDIAHESGQLYLLYKDNGPGFNLPAKNMTGMGLVLIKKRVSIMGGKVHIETGHNDGTRWIISLPASGNVIIN